MGNELSEYHLEAGITSLHCAAPTYEKTEWAKILELYDILYRLKPSPIVALNRAMPWAKPWGRKKVVPRCRHPEAVYESCGREICPLSRLLPSCFACHLT